VSCSRFHSQQSNEGAVTSVDSLYSCYFSMKKCFLPLIGAVDCPLFDFNLGLDLSSDSSVLVPSKPLVLTGLRFCTVVAQEFFFLALTEFGSGLVLTGLTILAAARSLRAHAALLRQIP
jgi:hypothetical protein